MNVKLYISVHFFEPIIDTAGRHKKKKKEITGCKICSSTGGIKNLVQHLFTGKCYSTNLRSRKNILTIGRKAFPSN